MKIICKECGKEHEAKQSNAEFCSISCWQKFAKKHKVGSNVEKTCKFCGKVFYVRKYREYTADCCSRHCSNSYVGRKNSKKTSDRMRGRGNGVSYEKFFHRHLHRVIMENHIGRKLTSKDIVHHINGNIHDNRIENLELVTRSEHCQLHWHGKSIEEVRDNRE